MAYYCIYVGKNKLYRCKAQGEEGGQENQYKTPFSNTVELEESTCIINVLLK